MFAHCTNLKSDELIPVPLLFASHKLPTRRKNQLFNTNDGEIINKAITNKKSFILNPRYAFDINNNYAQFHKITALEGVFANCKSFKDCFCENVLLNYPSLKVEMLSVLPEQGALNIARGLYE